MAEFVLKYAGPRDSVRQQIAIARQRRATVKPDRQHGCPRARLGSPTGECQRVVQRCAASRHRGTLNSAVTRSGVRILIRQQILVARQGRPALDPPVNDAIVKFKMPAGAIMIQEIKE